MLIRGEEMATKRRELELLNAREKLLTVGVVCRHSQQAIEVYELDRLVNSLRSEGWNIVLKDGHFVVLGPRLKGWIVPEAWPEPEENAIEAVSNGNKGNEFAFQKVPYGFVLKRNSVKIVASFTPPNWGMWEIDEKDKRLRDVKWVAASMLTAANKAVPELVHNPVGFMNAYSVVPYIYAPPGAEAYLSVRLCTTDSRAPAILIVSPVEKQHYTSGGWITYKVRVHAAVIADDAEVELSGWDPRTVVVRASRANGPWVAQEMAKEFAKVERAAIELGR